MVERFSTRTESSPGVSVERLAARRGERDRTNEELRAVRRSLQGLQVDYWRRGWDGSVEDAAVAVADEHRGEKRLRNRASEALLEALAALEIRANGEGAPNAELAGAARRRSQLSEDGEDARPPVASFEEVAGPMRDWLDAHQDGDRITADRISRSRERREQELALAERETGELHHDLVALQDAVEQRIRQGLDSISTAYDQLSQESGRYGADLQIEPTRPQRPQDRWRWEVTPRWRRSPGGRLLPYDNQANTAQEKLATVQLVLAALLAAPNPRGRVLVLDELGDSLGLAHRREVLREIAETAKAKGVTVLGTCQDSVLNDAASFCGELLYFEYPSLTEALNRPTRMFGFDENDARVELTADALESGRLWQ